jgi:ABC-2 type transport system permease protein
MMYFYKKQEDHFGREENNDMKFFQETQLLFMRHVKKTFRSPLWVLLGLMQPVLYLLLYMPLLRNLGGTSALPLAQIAQIFVPGMLVIMGVGTLFAGFSFIPEIREGFITRLLVTPASRVAILVSLILDRLVTLLLQGIVLLGIALLLGLQVSFVSILLTLALVALIGATMTSFSYVISITTKSEDGLASLVNTLYLPIMLLSGIMLPISLAPHWLQTAAHFNPFYYAVEAARALFLGKFGDVIILQGFIIMTIFAIFAVWAAVTSLRKMAA